METGAEIQKKKKKKKKKFTNDKERIMLYILMAKGFDNRNDSQNQRKFCHVSGVL